jgi:hypothetical protein
MGGIRPRFVRVRVLDAAGPLAFSPRHNGVRLRPTASAARSSRVDPESSEAIDSRCSFRCQRVGNAVIKCPECRIAPLRAGDGTCRYCDRTKARVVPGRVSMDRALKAFVVGTIVANVAVFGFRALIYVLNYLAVDDLANGDLSALDKIHMYTQWMMAVFWATIVSAWVLVRLQRQWMDAGNANALTRPEIGLGWFRGVPSGRVFQRWQLAQTFGYLAILFLNIVFRNSATTTSQVMAWAAIEITLCSVVIASSIAGAFSARDMTAQLLEQVALAEQAAQAEQATAPDLIA